MHEEHQLVQFKKCVWEHEPAPSVPGRRYEIESWTLQTTLDAGGPDCQNRLGATGLSQFEPS